MYNPSTFPSQALPVAAALREDPQFESNLSFHEWKITAFKIAKTLPLSILTAGNTLLSGFSFLAGGPFGAPLGACFFAAASASALGTAHAWYKGKFQEEYIPKTIRWIKAQERAISFENAASRAEWLCDSVWNHMTNENTFEQAEQSALQLYYKKFSHS